MRLLFEPLTADTAGPAIFIDRDGVINRRRPGDYVLDWSQFVFIPGIREALRRLSMLRVPMIVISNQAAVGRGLLNVAILEAMTAQLQEVLCGSGVVLNAYYYCTHRADEGCDCRKPKPGLLRQAAAEFDIDLSRSVFIGDADTDVQAARLAGCQPVLFDPEFRYPNDTADWIQNTPTARNANELVELTVKRLLAISVVAAIPEDLPR